MVQDAYRSTVMAVFRPTAKSEVMVLDPAGAEDGCGHIGREAVVIVDVAVGVVPGSEAVGPQHRQVLANGFHAAGAVIADAECTSTASAGGYLYII